ncbi:hypothetical protein EXIGLDRAFT_726571 [Exidia glandulosa HHB12029]|nr:hypothetical protein EXIGLDRAFT_726571 [Exidia glandulosa HHB12029]
MWRFDALHEVRDEHTPGEPEYLVEFDWSAAHSLEERHYSNRPLEVYDAPKR